MLYRTAIARSSAAAKILARPAFVARALPRSTTTAARLSLLRAYSAASAQIKESDTDDFFTPEISSEAPASQVAPVAEVATQASQQAGTNAHDEFFTTPEHTQKNVNTAARSAPNASPVSPKGSKATTKLMPFSELQGRIDHDILKSLTFKPFNLTAMSEVQKRVLTRMPELAGGKTPVKLQENESEGQTLSRKERVAAGREDLLVKAKTGTGKTIAFLVPAIEARLLQIKNLVTKPDESGEIPSSAEQGQIARSVTRSHVGTLIISPTRELATQIANEALKLCTWHKDMQVQLFIGGNTGPSNRREQLRKFTSIREGRKDILVATPGRLRDLINEPEVRDALATTDTLILDEADTLLELGFSDDLHFIMDHLPVNRQTFLFSATVSPAIAKVAKNALKPNHSVIDCVPKNESNVHLHIPQYTTVLPDASEQLPHVLRLIAQDQLENPGSKAIVFLPTTKLTMLFATLIRQLSRYLPRGTSVHEIHSRLDQDRRSRAADRFRRDNNASVLVTSDVSARGVDYPGVTRVIQVGIPSSADQYVHRVGRTGRGSSTSGRGDLVLLPFEAGFLQQLKGMPVKDYPAKDLISDLAGLAEAEPGIPDPAAIKNAAQGILPGLDPLAVNEVFTSLLGYYLARTELVGESTENVYEGLRAWSVGGAGLPEPPYLAPTFLRKMGIKDEGRGGGGFQQRSFPPRGDREGGFQKRTFPPRGDRQGGFQKRSFNPHGDREGGFQQRSFQPRGDREGGFQKRTFQPRGDREGGFQQRSFQPRGDREGGFQQRSFQPREGGFNRSSGGGSERRGPPTRRSTFGTSRPDRE